MIGGGIQITHICLQQHIFKIINSEVLFEQVFNASFLNYLGTQYQISFHQIAHAPKLSKQVFNASFLNYFGTQSQISLHQIAEALAKFHCNGMAT